MTCEELREVLVQLVTRTGRAGPRLLRTMQLKGGERKFATITKAILRGQKPRTLHPLRLIHLVVSDDGLRPLTYFAAEGIIRDEYRNLERKVRQKRAAYGECYCSARYSDYATCTCANDCLRPRYADLQTPFMQFLRRTQAAAEAICLHTPSPVAIGAVGSVLKGIAKSLPYKLYRDNNAVKDIVVSFLQLYVENLAVINWNEAAVENILPFFQTTVSTILGMTAGTGILSVRS